MKQSRIRLRSANEMTYEQFSGKIRLHDAVSAKACKGKDARIVARERAYQRQTGC